MPIGGIISGLGNLAGGIMQAKQSNKNTQAQIAHQRSMAERQYAHAIEQRDYMNQYNAPAQQMARFKEAGLNPHLIYGKGTAGAGQQTTTPQYQEQAPDYSKRKSIAGAAATGVGQMIGNYLDIQQKRAELMAQNQVNDIKQHEVDFLNTPGKGLSKHSVQFEREIMEKNKAYWDNTTAANKARMSTQQWESNEERIRAELKAAELSNMHANKGLTLQKLDIAKQKMMNAVYKNSTAKGLNLNEWSTLQGWSDINNGELTIQARKVILGMGSDAVKIMTEIGKASMLGGIAGKALKNKPATWTHTQKYDKSGKTKGSSVTTRGTGN